MSLKIFRPEVRIDDLGFYDFYEGHKQNQIFARIAHLYMAHEYEADITADEGLEESIRTERANGSRIVISPNHLTDKDQDVILSVIQRYKPLHFLRGHTFIPAKESLFTRPGFKGKLLRFAVDELGAVPTTRTKDLEENHDDEVTEQYVIAREMASKVQVNQLVVVGSNMAVFWEAARNRENFQEVQPLKSGPCYTLDEAKKQGIKSFMLPVGMYFGGEPDDYNAKYPKVPEQNEPKIHLGSLIPFETNADYDPPPLLHPAMQRCVDIVVKRTIEE